MKKFVIMVFIVFMGTTVFAQEKWYDKYPELVQLEGAKDQMGTAYVSFQKATQVYFEKHKPGYDWPEGKVWLVLNDAVYYNPDNPNDWMHWSIHMRRTDGSIVIFYLAAKNSSFWVRDSTGKVIDWVFDSETVFDENMNEDRTKLKRTYKTVAYTTNRP